MTLSGNGIPEYDIVEGVAWDALEADAGTLELAARADAVCWGSLAQRSETSRRAIASILEATRPECLKVFDINIRQHWYSREIVTASLGQADVLKLNEDELPLVASLLGTGKSGAEAIAELVRAFSLRYVVYTGRRRPQRDTRSRRASFPHPRRRKSRSPTRLAPAIRSRQLS